MASLSVVRRLLVGLVQISSISGAAAAEGLATEAVGTGSSVDTLAASAALSDFCFLARGAGSRFLVAPLPTCFLGPGFFLPCCGGFARARAACSHAARSHAVDEQDCS